MKVAVPREIIAGEPRVAMVPETVGKLAKAGMEIAVEAGAGEKAYFADEAYEAAGATVVSDAAALWGEAQLVVKINPPTTDASAARNELELLRPGVALVAILNPTGNLELVRALAAARVTSFSLDAVPRITRAQSMDVLSSMSTLAGYRAVLVAAAELPKLLPMMMTAAGTVRAASVLVIGAGVAGLQAVATAKRLGAVVKAVDARPAVGEQVESLGARFVPLEVEHDQAEDAGGYARDLGEEFYRREQEVLAPHVKGADIVITTAMIPGRRAPVLITEAMVQSMRPGSVVVDLAGPSGGNCALTRIGERIRRHGVTVIAPLNLAAEMPVHASEMYSRNVASFVDELVRDGQMNLDMENEILRGMLITHDGRVVHEPTHKAMAQQEAKP